MKRNKNFKMSIALLGFSVFAFNLLVTSGNEAFAEEVQGNNKKVDVIAHRGASGYAPENTIAAFDKAVKMKADYIEIDVQRSKDNKLVLIHDNTVDRTTNGTGLVSDLTFKQLRYLDAGSWKGEQFTGEKIPTLGEALDKYRGKIGILIELKSPELYPGIEEQVARALKERNLDKPKNNKIIIQSFNFDSMKKMNTLLPSVPIGVLTSFKGDTSEQALSEFSQYADYFNPSYSIVSKPLVEQVHALGMKIQSWTVRSHESAEFLLSMNVDGIITDYPDYIKSK